jgi:hypothetical protein
MYLGKAVEDIKRGDLVEVVTSTTGQEYIRRARDPRTGVPLPPESEILELENALALTREGKTNIALDLTLTILLAKARGV